MSTFYLFPKLPNEMRLKIYENTFEARILQLGIDAGVPLPPELDLLGARTGPTKQLHTHLPSLFAAYKESRDLCKSISVAFRRILATGLKAACNYDGSSEYYHPVAGFDTVAIGFGAQDYPEDLVGWKQRLVRRGVREFCAPGISMWRATDYAAFFRCFGGPREVLLVSNGVLRWAGGLFQGLELAER
ncbi:hypothetical protein LAWI1_G001642 [Lachnellula willkommii]|uniref:2EXR domain-containing protein n=1 Tax=Lachnellula willkommii TaxID=215461 RepID=A0A559ML42_9HELO|nr:hypothetical protein LAWI1_G001642 [Lachnellula willkommii]